MNPDRGIWEDENYCWVVLCKNHWYHVRENFLFRHRIILGRTDAVSPPPKLHAPFSVKCDTCEREYLYDPSDLLRYEAELPDSFTPHLLFHE